MKIFIALVIGLVVGFAIGNGNLTNKTVKKMGQETRDFGKDIYQKFTEKKVR